MSQRLRFLSLFKSKTETITKASSSRRRIIEELESRLAPAAHTWSGAVDGSWLNPANWSAGGAPAFGESNVSLTFGAVSGAKNMTDNIPNLTVSQIIFTGTGYTLSGDTSPITLNLATSISDTLGGNSISATNLTINLTATASITVSAGSTNIDAPITAAGTFGLTKLGGGTLVLNGSNSYTGVTTMSAGTISVSSLKDGGVSSGIGAAGAGGGNIVFSGGTLAYTGADATIDRGATVAVASGSGIDVIGGTNLTIAGAVSSSIGGSAVLTKSNTGTLTLGGSTSTNNIYLGANVTGGTLVLAKATIFNTTCTLGGTLTIGPAGTVKIAGSGGDQIYQSAAGGVVNNGVFDLNGTSEGIDVMTGTGIVTNTATGTATLTLGEVNGSGTFSGVIQDGGAGMITAITKKGGGNITLGGASANTYTGLTTAAGGGPLILQKTAGVAAVSSSIQIGMSGVAGFLLLGAADQIPDSAMVSFANSAGTFRLAGFNETIGGLSDSTTGGIVENTGATSATLTLSGSTDSSFNGYLRNNGAGLLLVTKSGSATQTYASGNITYTGQTLVTGGTLKITPATTGFGSTLNSSGSGIVEFNSTSAQIWTTAVTGSGTYNKTGSALLTFQGSNQAISFSGTFNVLAGSMQNNNNSVNWSACTGTLFVDANTTFDLYADPIFLDKLTGTGTVRNTYGNTGGLQSGSSASTEKLTIGVAGGDSQFDGILTDNGVAVGSGGANQGLLEIEKTGAGTFTLGGANAFKGISSVTGGTLKLKNTLALQNTVVATGGTGIAFDPSVSAYTWGGLSGAAPLTLADTLSNPIALSVGNNNVNATISTVITGPGSFVKIGSGATILTGANTYTGATGINAGVLTPGVAEGSGNGPFGNGGTITMAGGTLQYGIAGNLTDYSSRFSTAGGQTFKIDTGSFTVTFASPISGTGTGLTKLGSGTLNIIGAASNTYTGTTILDNGVLTFGKTGGAVAISGPITMGGGNGNQPSLRMAAAQQFGSGVVMTNANAVGNYPRFEMIGWSQTLAGIQDALGGLVVENSGQAAGTSTDVTLTLNGSGTYSHAGYLRNFDIANGVGKVLVNFSGSGQQTFVGTNITYTGATTVNAGRLIVSNPSNSSFTSSVTVNSGGKFAWSGTSTVNPGAPVRLNDGGTLEDLNPSNWVVMSAPVTVAPGANVSINIGSNATSSPTQGFFLDGGVTGSTGTITINATNAGNSVNLRSNNLSFNGTIIVNGIADPRPYFGSGLGVGGSVSAFQTVDLQVNGAVELLAGGMGWANSASTTFGMGALSGSGVVVGNSATTVTMTVGVNNHSGNFSGNIASGVGVINLVKAGSGTQTLSGADTFTGTVTVNGGAGSVILANPLALQNAIVGSSTGIVFDSSVGTHAFTFGALTGSLNFSLADSGANPVTLSIGNNNAATNTYSGVLSGGGSLVKVGTGVAILSGANNYAGTTTISAGTLQFAKPAAFYNNVQSNWTASNVTVAAGATLSLNVGGPTDFATTDVNTLLTNLSTVNNNGLLAGSFVSLDTTNATGPVTYSGAITDSTGTGGGAVGLNRIGAGTLVMSGANTYTGPTFINSGTVRFATAGSLYNGSTASWTPTNITVANGATLAVNVGGSGEFATADAATLFGNLSTGVNNNGLKLGAIVGIDTTNAAGDVVFSNVLTNSTGTGGGAVGFVKLGTGALVLSGANTYTGGTIVGAGTLKVGNASALPLAMPGPLSLGVNATLDLNGFDASVSDISSSAATSLIIDNSGTAGTSYFTITNELTTSAGPGATNQATMNGLMKDGPMRAVGVKVANNNIHALLFPMNAANTFSGGTYLLYNPTTGGTGTRIWIGPGYTASGTAGNITSSPYGRGPIVIGQAPTDKAGILIYQVSNITIPNDIVFNTVLGNDFRGVRSDSDGITLSGTITANQSNIEFSSGGGVTFNLTGKVTGSQGLTFGIQGNANVMLNNANNDNDYQGPTTVPANRVLSLGRSNQIPDGASAGTVSVSGSFNLNGFNETINGLTGGGTVDGVSGTPTLTIGANDANQTFSGVVKNSAGTLNLVKTGTGTETLSGANTFSGQTSVTGGTLLLTNSLALQNSVVNPGGVVFSSPLTAFTFGGLTGTGNVTLANSAAAAITLSVGNATSTYGGSLSGAGSLTKVGSGKFTMTGANSYTGVTTVSAGTLTFGTEVSLYNGVSANWTATNLVVGSGATAAFNVGGSGEFTSSDIALLDTLGTPTGGFANGSILGLDTTNAGGSFTLSDAISDPFGGANVLNLTKLGAGTLVMAAANTYTGITTIVAGTIAVAFAETPGVSGPLGKKASNATGSIVTTGGSLQYTAANNFDYSGRFSTAAGQTFSVDTNGQDVSWAAGLRGTGSSLSKSGSGTLTLSGYNTYTGATNVSAGTLKLVKPTIDPQALLSGIGSNTVWLDAADVNATGTNPASGTAISAWINKVSGGAGDFTRTSSSIDPIVYSVGNTMNGLPLVHFDTGLLTNQTNFGNTVTIMYVGRMAGGANGRLVSDSANNFILGFHGGNYNRDYWNGVGNLGGIPVDYGVHAFVGSANGTTATSYNFDGAETPFGSTVTLGNGPNKMTLGGSAQYGEVSYADIGELLVFSSALSPTQRAQVEQYLQNKWLGVLPFNTSINLTASGATLDLNGVNQTVGSITGVVGTEIKLGSGTLTTGGDNTNATFSGTISGAGGITKDGSGKLTLAGTDPNTYTGTTLVRQGAFVLSKSAGVAAVPGNITMVSNLTPTMWFTADNQMSANTVLSFTSEAALTSNNPWFLLAGTTQTIGGINASDAARVGVVENGQSGAPNSPPLTSTTGVLVLAGSGTYSYNAHLRDFSTGAGKLAIVKTGSGTQTFTGDRIGYTGTTTVNGGTLAIVSATGGGATPMTGATTINGGTLTLANATVFSAPIAINSTGTLKLDGTSSWTLSGNSPIALNDGGTLEYAVNTGNVTVSSAFGMNGAVTNSGNTTVNLTAPTNNTGGLFFDGGLKGTGTVTINANNRRIGAQFRNQNNTFAGTMIVNGIADTGTGASAGSGIGVSGANVSFQNIDIQLNGTMEMLTNSGTLGWANNPDGTFKMGALSGSGVVVGNYTGGGVISPTFGNTDHDGNFTGVIANGVGNILQIFKIGNGTQTLSGNNTSTGLITVNGGTLNLNGTNATTGTLTVNNAGILNVNGATSTGSVSINNTGLVKVGSSTALTGTGTLSMANSGTLDLNGNDVTFTNIPSSAATNAITDNSGTSGTSFLTLSAHATTVNALVKDGATRKVGVKVSNNQVPVGVIPLFPMTSANTYSGGTIILTNAAQQGSRLSVNATPTTTGAPGALTSGPFGTGPITVGQTTNDRAGILFYTGGGGNISFPYDVIVNTLQGNDYQGIRSDSLTITMQGTITGNLAPVVFSTAAAGTQFIVTGKITGAQGLTLGGNNPNSGAGGANSAAIVVTLNNTSTANDYQGATTVSSGSTLKLGANDQIPDGATSGTVTVSGTFDLNGKSDAIGGLAGAGNVDGNAAGTVGANTLTFGANNGTASFTGVIKNTVGTLNIVKAGSGTETVSGANTFTGTTTVTGGILNLGTATTLQNNVITLSGGTLNFDSAAGTAFTIGGLAGSTDVALVNTASVALTALSIGNTTTPASVAVYTGGLTGSGNITKIGTSIQTFAGTNVNTGKYTVNAGMLFFGKEVSLYNNTTSSWTPANLTVASGATLGFRMGGSGEFTGTDINTFAASSFGTATTGFLTGSNIGFDTTNASGTVTYSGVLGNTNGTNVRGVSKFGVGTMLLSGANIFTGGIEVSQGTLDMGTAGTVGGGANSSIFVGDVGGLSGTLVISGGTVISALSTIIGFNGGNGTLNVSGTGVLQTNGGNTFASPQEGGLNVGLGATSVGTVNLTGGLINVKDNFVMAGRNGTSKGTINVSGGTLKTSGTAGGQNRRIHLGWDSDTSATPATLANRSGGTLNVTGSGTVITNESNASTYGGILMGYQGFGKMTVDTGATVTINAANDSEGGLIVGYANAGNATDAGGMLNITGGTITVNNNHFALGYTSNGTGIVTQSGGTVNVNSAALAVGYGGNGVGTYTQTAGAVNIQNYFLIEGWNGTSTGTLNIGGTATMKTFGTTTNANFKAHIGWDTGTGGSTLNLSGSGSLTLNANNTSSADSGMIIGNTGLGFVNVSGSATLTINGVNDTNYGGITLSNSSGGNGTLTQTGGLITVNDNYIKVGGVTTGVATTGSGTGVGTINVSGGTLKISGTAANANRRLYLGMNTSTSQGTLNVSGTGTVLLNENNITAGTGGNALVVGSSGIGAVTISASGSLTVNALGDTTFGGITVGGSAVASTFAQTGGTVTVNSNNVNVGTNATAAGTLTVGGGTFTVPNGIKLGTIAGTNATLNLNGGTLTTSGDITSTAGTSTLNFNGGTLKAGANFAVGALSLANVRNGGAIFDANGKTVTINPGLFHSDIGGDNAIDGGVTNVGASGTVTLVAANTYTGATTVNSGTLTLNGSAPSSSVTVVSGLLTIGSASTVTTTSGASVTGGRIDVNGSLIGNVTVSSSAAVGGSGTITGSLAGAGKVSPGTAGTAGTLRVIGAFGPVGSLEMDILGGALADQVSVVGSVNLTNTNLSFIGSYVPTQFDSYNLVENDGNDAIVGTLNGYPEGTPVTINGSAFAKNITYVGNTGNDVVLVVPGQVTNPAGTVTAAFASGTLVIQDANGSKDNTFRVVVSGPNLVITSNEPFVAAPSGGGLSPDFLTLTMATSSLIADLNFDTAGGNDTVTLDYSSGVPFPTGNVSVFGGTSTTADRVILTGGSATTIAASLNGSNGTIAIDSKTLTFTGLEAVTDLLAVANRSFAFQAGVETVTLGDTGTSSDGVDRIQSTLSLPYDFAAPSTSFKVTTNGGDTVNLSALDSTFAPTGITFEDLTAPTTVRLPASELLPDSSNLTLTSNVTLDLLGHSETVGALGGAGTIDSSLPGTMTFSFGTGGGSASFTGKIKNTAGALSIVKAGSGTVSLSGSNFYSGSTTVSVGTLNVTSANSAINLSNTFGGLNIADTAHVKASSYYSPDDRAPWHTSDWTGQTLVGTFPGGTANASPGATMWLSNGTTGSGTYIAWDLGSVYSSITGAHVWNYNEGSPYIGRGVKTFDLQVATSAPPEFGGTGTWTTVQTVDWSNTALYQGSGAAGYAGFDFTWASTLNARYIRFNNTQNYGTSDAYTGLAEVVFTQPRVIPSSSPITVATGATLGIGSSESFNNLSGGGRIAAAAGASVTVTVGGANDSYSFGGFAAGSGTLSVTKIGAGTITLTAANTYTGTTTVSQGTLDLGSSASNAVGSSTAAVTVADVAGQSATFSIGGGTLAASSITVGANGTGTFNTAAAVTVTGDFNIANVTTGSGTATVSGGSLAARSVAVGVNAAGTLNVSGGAVTTSGGTALSGGGGFIIGLQNAAVGIVNQTGGTVTVNNNFLIAGRYNTSQGTYNISGGTLKTAGTSGDRRMYFGWDTSTVSGTLNASGAGTVIVNNDSTSGSDSLQLGYLGTGTLTVAGSATVTINAVGEASYPALTVGFNSTGVLTQTGGTINVNNGPLTVGWGYNAAGAVGTLNLSGGTINVKDSYIMAGHQNNAVGTINVSGGTLQTIGTAANGNRKFHLGWSSGATGSLNLSGSGSIVVNKDNTTAGSGGSAFVAGSGGQANVVMSGGSLLVNALGETSYSGISIGAITGSAATFTQSGGAVTVNSTPTWVGQAGTVTATLNILGGTFTSNAGLRISGGGATTGIVNLDGGTLATGGNITTAGGSSTLNVNGGTLKASGTATVSGLTNAYVYSGNGTIDNGGNGFSIGQNLIAPTGNGVTGIGSIAGGAGYVTAPLVSIARGAGDTTGVGATAIATISGGVVTGITITNPGVGYTAVPVFTLNGGGYTVQANVTGAAPTPLASGGMSFQGSGSGITSLAGVNTYSGATVVNSGTVTLAANGTLATASSVTVNAAAFDIMAADASGRTFANNLTLNGGAVHGVYVTLGTGGNDVSVVGNTAFHTFTSTGTFVLPAGVSSFSGVVVGGGGGGGGSSSPAVARGGGGGGGEVVPFSGVSIPAGTNNVVVGSGGGAGATGASGGDGLSSNIGGNVVVARGGQGGQNGPAVASATRGKGGANGNPAFAGGNSGGTTTPRSGGGGGGASAPGGAGTATNPGAGGAGLFVPLTGLTYGGGGGGGFNAPGGTGGAGGGGNGANNGAGTAAGAGTDGLGGGGGGAANGIASAAGGSGVVVIAYTVVTGAAPLNLTGNVTVSANSTLDPTVTLGTSAPTTNTFLISAQARTAAKVSGGPFIYNGKLQVINTAGTMSAGNYLLVSFTSPAVWDGSSKFTNDTSFQDVPNYAGADLPSLAGSGLQYHFDYATGVLSVVDATPPTHFVVTSTTIADTTYGSFVTFTVEARKPDEGVSTSYVIPVTISVATSSFVNSTITSKNTTNGSATFQVWLAPGSNVVLTASGGSLTPADSNSFAVAKKNLTISGVTADNKTYNTTTDATGDASGAALSGLVFGDSVGLMTNAVTFAFADPNAGTDKPVTASGFSLTNANSVPASYYNLVQTGAATATIFPVVLLITGVTANSKVYDGTAVVTAPSGTPALDGVFPSDAANVVLNGNASYSFADANVETDKSMYANGLSISGSASGNYVLFSSALTDAVADITPRVLSLGGLSAIGREYDGTPAASVSGTPFLVGVLAADQGQVSFSGTPAYAFTTANAGSNKPVVATGLTIAGSASDNYTLSNLSGSTSTNATAIVTQKSLTITGLTANDKPYDGNTTATVSGTATLVGVITADVPNVVLGGTPAYAFADPNIGTNKPVTASGFTISGSASGNYSLSQPTGLTASITSAAAAPTVTAVTPFIGPTTGGGITLVITGTDFTGVTAVKFKTNAAGSFTYISATQINAVAPSNSGVVEVVDVTVTTPGGTSSTAGSGNDYTYATPSITSVVVNGSVINTLTGATWTGGNASITVDSTSGLFAGSLVSSFGAGFPTNGTVVSVDSGTTFTLSSAPSASQSTATTILATNAPKKSGTILQLTNATWTNGSAIVTVASTAGLQVGQYVGSTAAGLPTDSVVASIDSGTTFTMSSAASATQSTPTTIEIANGSVVRDRNGTLVDLSGQNSVVASLLVTFNMPVTLDSNSDGSTQAFSVTSLSSSVTALGIAPSSVGATLTAAGVTGTGNSTNGYTQYILNFVNGTAVSNFSNASAGGFGNAFSTIANGFFQLNSIGAKIHAGASDVAAARAADPFWVLYGAVNAGDIKITGTPGDGNDTLLVDGLALNDIYRTFGSFATGTTPPYSRPFDRDLDGDVDGSDLNTLYQDFGTIWKF